MAIIYVGRHGQDYDNANGILNGHRNQPLTPLGLRQADTLADKLVDKDITRIYSSPLLRAVQTAEIVSAKLGHVVIRTLSDLIERDFGVMTGLPVADIIKLTPPGDLLITEKIHYFLRAEGAEEFKDVYARVGKVADFIREAHPNENVFISGHGDVAKTMRAYYCQWNWYNGLLAPYVDNCDVIALENGTETTQ